jgi:uncharacterized protein
MIDLKPIVHAILDGYALPWHGIHGVGHWAKVLENGLRLAQETGAKVEIVQLFAVFHDSRRINEGVDDGHGRRGADLAAEFREKWFDLADDDFELLQFARAHHTDGMIDGDVTAQVCWDADRLDLGRVGTVPKPERLCTAAAKAPTMLKWADGRAGFEVVPELVMEGWGIDLRRPGN